MEPLFTRLLTPLPTETIRSSFSPLEIIRFCSLARLAKSIGSKVTVTPISGSVIALIAASVFAPDFPASVCSPVSWFWLSAVLLEPAPEPEHPARHLTPITPAINNAVNLDFIFLPPKKFLLWCVLFDQSVILYNVIKEYHFFLCNSIL